MRSMITDFILSGPRELAIYLDFGAAFDAFLKNRFTHSPKINFDFCIAFFCIYAIVYLFRLWRRFSKPEVVCVTGLPARTARPFVPSFFSSRLLHQLLRPQSLVPAPLAISQWIYPSLSCPSFSRFLRNGVERQRGWAHQLRSRLSPCLVAPLGRQSPLLQPHELPTDFPMVQKIRYRKSP